MENFNVSQDVGLPPQIPRKFPPKKLLLLAILAAILVVFGLTFFLKKSPEGILSPAQYEETYTLVNDKVSESAAIQINLPEGFDKGLVPQGVSFEPEIKGRWLTSNLASVAAFKPSKKLETGKYYKAVLATAGGTIEKDFMADEDPSIVEIFPAADSEVTQASAITIVFNRPMVPLTALSETENMEIPVTIAPQTPGKFKWISTRTLQFIPTSTLIPSANYEVKVNSGFISMDGLPVKARTHKFKTTPIRFLSSSSGEIIYSKPIEFRFNVPVDLEKTAAALRLKNLSADKNIEFEIEYGSKTIYDLKSRKDATIPDKTVVRVIQKQDKFGRKNLWDFEESYEAALGSVYPAGGDIIISEKLRSNVSSSGIIKNVSVLSERTTLASEYLFDPQGALTLSFFEDINLSKSDFAIKGLRKIEYGEKCKDAEAKGYYSPKCEKVPDQAVLVFRFDADKFTTKGETIPLMLRKIVTATGLEIKSDLQVSLKVYPGLQITKITPANNSAKASVTGLTICSNSPLSPQGGEDFKTAIVSDKYIVLGEWNQPYIQNYNSYEKNPPCAVDEYVSRIRYGLLPNESYNLVLNLKDVFGQTVQRKITFQTEPAPKFYLRLQSLNQSYNVTTPDKTILTYAAENFDVVNVKICKINPQSALGILTSQPQQTDSGDGLPCIQTKYETVAMPPKMWVNNYFQIDLKKYWDDPKGFFIISLGNPKYLNQNGAPIYERTYVNVTNLAVGEKRVETASWDQNPKNTKDKLNATPLQGGLYWVNTLSDLKPVSGAVVSVYRDPKIQGASPIFAHTIMTGADGVAIVPPTDDVMGAVVRYGNDAAIITSWSDTLNWSGTASTENRAYIYTDRPIYRPGQTVNIKGIYRQGFDGLYGFDPNQTANVSVRASNGETLLSQNIPMSKYGTFSTTVKLPENAPTGGYYISALDQYAYFEVEEYVGAAFEAKAQTEKDEYISGEEVAIDVSGKYYFGVPVDAGAVNYTFTSQNFYFDRYTDEYFNFGSDWYYCYDCGYGDSFIKRGQTQLDTDGKARIVEKIDFDKLFNEKDGNRDQSKIIVFNATITNKQGKSVSVEKSFIVHRGEIYLGVKTDPFFAGKNERFNLRLKTVDTQGKPVRQSDIEIEVSKVTWESYKRQEVDAGYYNISQRVLTPVLKRSVSTNGRGDFSDEFTLEEAGEYEISASTKDSLGNTISTKTSVYIYGSKSISIRPTNNAAMTLSTDKKNLKVGETASVLFESQSPKAKALITTERGRIFDYKIIDLSSNLYKHEFTIMEDYAPNIYASVLLLSPAPEIKFGQIEFIVNQDSKKIDVRIESDKPAYLPGEKVNLTIRTLDSGGRGIPAEVSVSVADMSVLALKGNPKKNPLSFFYGGFGLAVKTLSNLKNLLHEVPIPTGTKGGGGSSAEDLSKHKRGEFLDTAFWKAEVETNASGSASVSFTLPDNLTQWQVESVAISQDSKVGAGYKEFTARKNIMAVPLRPRFALPGDEFEIGAQIFNQTQESQRLMISYESATLPINGGDTNTAKTLKAGESVVLYFKVKSPLEMQKGVHKFTLSAKSDAFEDTVENEIPIKANITKETTATAGATKNNSETEYIYIPREVREENGGIKIRTNATLAVFLDESLSNLSDYIYGGSGGIASKLAALSIIKKGLKIQNGEGKVKIDDVYIDGQKYAPDEAVKVGLKKIYESQNSDGGFGYYNGSKSNTGLSISTLSSLGDVKSAGYAVDDGVLSRAAAFIGNKIREDKKGRYGTDMKIAAAHAISKAGINPATLIGEIQSLANGSYLDENSSSLSLGLLAELAILEKFSDQFLNRVLIALKNRVDIDSRGSYIKINRKNINWTRHETPVKDTALFLKVIALSNTNNTQTDEIMRWLFANKKSGSYGSSEDTLAVIDAFTSFLIASDEMNSRFTLAVSIDSQELGKREFNKQTILTPFEKFLPISDLKKNTIQKIQFTKTDSDATADRFYYDLELGYYLPAQNIPPRDEGVTVSNQLFRMDDEAMQNPVLTAKVGEVLKGEITILTGKPRKEFGVESFIPVGFELVNFNLATEDQTLQNGNNEYYGDEGMGVNDTSEPAKTFVKNPGIFRKLWNSMLATPAALNAYEYENLPIWNNNLYPEITQYLDDRLFLFRESLPAGSYTYEYYLRATTPGTFSYPPTVASELYFPENFGRTAGAVFVVEK